MTQKSALFKNLPSPTIGNMMEVMKLEIFPPNDIIIKIGSEIGEVYFISSGAVAIMTSDGKELCHLADGEEFGTNCLFFQKRKYAVVGIETTEVFIIDKNQLIEFLHLYPDVINGFYRSIKQKLAKLKNLEECATTTSQFNF
ncbi:potassium/sodium hyperpolarization-activated cyclic nucleotide-gated channel 2-like [Anoplophora glabripennis]|uniref:potassium/sodium hyperpolarization-activated cyclic nucleotide-gated channel 2-like n=1 Tax=Anoplophora glabripennis TaxID=217634 RepID=UPI000C790889|nr:potassium/sodium hyperpolarization-activated cyclic nucleotide-gated channel 2-like [Anoplophora glabripennis]